MERGRSSLVSNSTLRAGIFKASIRPPGYPSAWVRSRRARCPFARQDHCNSTMPIRLNLRLARDPSRIAVQRGDHFLQPDFSPNSHIGRTSTNNTLTGFQSVCMHFSWLHSEPVTKPPAIHIPESAVHPTVPPHDEEVDVIRVT